MATRWESIGNVLTSANGAFVLITLIILLILFAIFVKLGIISIHTKNVSVGVDVDELNIVRQQVEWAHIYIMSLSSKIEDDKEQYNGYFTKYILERVYDEVVDWITFNHIRLDSDYISIKQDKICSLVYGFRVQPKFRTPEFKQRMCNWTREVIERLALIRQVYKR